MVQVVATVGYMLMRAIGYELHLLHVQSCYTNKLSSL